MLDEAELVRFRDGFAAGAACFGGDVDILAGQRWWALSGLRHADYNLALVYDGDVVAHVSETMDRIAGAGVPALVMLAGRGLAAAQRLADAGWVCAGASPLMLGTVGNSWDPAGARLRELTATDAAEVTRIVAASFSVAPETAARVYGPEVLATPGLTAHGLDVDGRLAATALVHRGEGLATSWALAVDPALRRRRLAAGLMGAVLDSVFTADPSARMIGLVTPPAEALYRTMGGAQAVEYWQLWSRPRWMLGSA